MPIYPIHMTNEQFAGFIYSISIPVCLVSMALLALRVFFCDKVDSKSKFRIPLLFTILSIALMIVSWERTGILLDLLNTYFPS